LNREANTILGLSLTIIQAQAPPAVLALLAQGDADNLAQGTLSDRDRRTLFAMKAWIDSKLAAMPLPQPEEQAEQVATPASTTTEKIKDEGIGPTDEDVEMLL
jgi:hypothetical protein